MNKIRLFILGNYIKTLFLPGFHRQLLRIATEKHEDSTRIVKHF